MISFDESFIEKLKQQDHNAFNTFYLETIDTLFRYIHANYFLDKNNAEDIISNFYTKFWEAIKKYDSALSFSAYFRTIFKNTIKDHFKKHSDITFSQINNDNIDINFEDMLIEEESIENFLQQDFQFEQIQEAIKKLDEISKDIIYLRFIEEKSNEEISKIMEISNENVRKKISRALQYLRQLLQ